MTRSRIDPFVPEWSVFRAEDGAAVVVPRAALLIRLRRVIGEEYFVQDALAPLKRFMNAIFIAGPLCVLLSLYLPWGETWQVWPIPMTFYLPPGGGWLIWLGITSLAIASLYWFAPHLLCRLYLTRRGYPMTGSVVAADFEAALAKAGEIP